MSHSRFVRSFPPIAATSARGLVLGSMPGMRSLQAGQYYAHPQNRFWPFMGALLDAGPDLPYPVRCARLTRAGLAVWDALASCEREGSLDSAIRDDTAQPNDFAAFLDAHPYVDTVLFNGSKAEASFRRLVLPRLDSSGLRLQRLPSTSPANASQPVAAKLAAWREAFGQAGLLEVEGAATTPRDRHPAQASPGMKPRRTR